MTHLLVFLGVYINKAGIALNSDIEELSDFLQGSILTIFSEFDWLGFGIVQLIFQLFYPSLICSREALGLFRDKVESYLKPISNMLSC